MRALSARFRLHVDPLPPVGQLPVGQQQRVEILKALYRDARILILDEPTAVLAPQEVTELFSAIRALIEQGRTVIFIAHKLPEVLAISDRITVMRGGKTVGEVVTGAVTEQSLATMMVGREVVLRVERKPHEGKVTLAVNKLRLLNEKRTMVCDDVTLTVRTGEIVGLVGVEGNGQAELLEAVAGLRSSAQGDIVVDGESIMLLGVHARRGQGHGERPGRPYRARAGGRRLRRGEPRRDEVGRPALRPPRSARPRRDPRECRAPDRALLDPRRRFVRRGRHTLGWQHAEGRRGARAVGGHPKVLLVSQPTRGVDLGADAVHLAHAHRDPRCRCRRAAELRRSLRAARALRPAGRVLWPDRRCLPQLRRVDHRDARRLHAGAVEEADHPEEMRAALA